LRRFPANPFAIKAIAETLKELCSTDQEALALVGEVLSRFDEFPGLVTMRRVHHELRESQAANARAEWVRAERSAHGPERDAHEATCRGYRVELNEEHKTVHVSFCGYSFGDITLDLACRKGYDLRNNEPTACERILAAELAVRPGWISDNHWLDETFKRRHASC
jgi:hypothetical protein